MKEGIEEKNDQNLTDFFSLLLKVDNRLRKEGDIFHVTASKLYNYLQCSHRVWRDAHGPQDEKSLDPNPFVEMLWNRGVQYEKQTLQGWENALDLSQGSYSERFNKTINAMKDGIPLIYQGLLEYKNLRGIPDFLKLMPDGFYAPLDVKSGMGREGISEDEEENEGGGTLKATYAVQLALYIDVLQRLGFEHRFKGYIYDIHGDMVEYDLTQPRGKRNKESWWDYYQKTFTQVEALINNQIQNDPALSSACSLCPWYESCTKWIKETDDMTGVFYLGRANRDRIKEELGVFNIEDLKNIDVDVLLEEKKKDKEFLKGIGEKMLQHFKQRSYILKDVKKPVLYESIKFPQVTYELFFDIEDDPTQEFVYLHGVYERSPQGERFVPFVAKGVNSQSEKEAWSEFWNYIRSLPENDYVVYYYSHHEKTTYKRLQRKYPDVVSMEEVIDFYEQENVIDLYKIVSQKTDWPTASYGLKALAKYCGFTWRDKTPSGALSIQWYNEYVKTGDEDILKRILEYNEDDCKATMVVKDKIASL